MDLTKLKKLADAKAAGPKVPPPGMAGVWEIAEAVGMTPAKVGRLLAKGKVRRVGTIRGAGGAPGFAYYDLEQVAVALGLQEGE